MTFSAKKAAQVVAFFARERGGAYDVIEASKLVYLADRAFMDRFGLTILGDRFCQMKLGPVCSSTYDLIKGRGSEEEREVWESYVRERDYDTLRVSRTLEDDDLDELSDAELEIMYEVHSEFAHLQGFELVEWVHKNCSEWKNPGNTSTHLSAEEIFQELKKPNSEQLDSRLRAYGRLQQELKRAK